MSRPVAVLRPEPGNATTAGRIEASGLVAIRLPLFAARPLAWNAPDTRLFDALLLTSANAVRHAGRGLATLADLPVLAVGDATARTARAAGLAVWIIGGADVSALLEEAAAMGISRAVHLAGRDRAGTSPIVAEVVTVYASEPIAPDPATVQALAGAVALLHSPRAASRLAELIDAAGIARATIRLAALSEAVARAAGAGWDRIAIAAAPTDAALLCQARLLAG